MLLVFRPFEVKVSMITSCVHKINSPNTCGNFFHVFHHTQKGLRPVYVHVLQCTGKATSVRVHRFCHVTERGGNYDKSDIGPVFQMSRVHILRSAMVLMICRITVQYLSTNIYCNYYFGRRILYVHCTWDNMVMCSAYACKRKRFIYSWHDGLRSITV